MLGEDLVAIMANYHVAFGCNGNLVEFPMIPYKLRTNNVW